VRKSVFVLDAEHAVIIAEIDSTNVCDIAALHERVLSPQADTAGEAGFCRRMTLVIRWRFPRTNRARRLLVTPLPISAAFPVF
jgi:hypothetical protein